MSSPSEPALPQREVLAPGKLVLCGAYAVLDGAAAIVVAVDRHARAGTKERAPTRSPEFIAAFGEELAPVCDTSSMRENGKKLGLGSSAAALVAALGADEAWRGGDLESGDVRSRIFSRAREAHRAAQGGGSGVDIAASTYGGVLRYKLVGGKPWIASVDWPAQLAMEVFFSGESAKTSALLASVAAFRNENAGVAESVFAELSDAANEAAELFSTGSVREILSALGRFSDALRALGEEADAPIFPLSFLRLDVAAREEGGLFFPSGAGGGDVGVFLGERPASEKLIARAKELGLLHVPMKIDPAGVRLKDSPDGATR